MTSNRERQRKEFDIVRMSSSYYYTDDAYKGPGIYMLYNHSTNKYYVGLSVNYRGRIRRHFLMFDEGIHANKRLMRSFRRGDNIQGMLLESCKREDLIERELFWIGFLDAMNPDKGYNLTKGGDGLVGYIASEETRRKSSLARKGKKKYNIGNEKAILAYKIPTGEFYKEYQSTQHASRDLGIASHNITGVLKGAVKTAREYIFKYKVSDSYPSKLKYEISPKAWVRLIYKIDIESGERVGELRSYMELGKELGISNTAARSRIVGKGYTTYNGYKYEIWQPIEN